MTASRFPDAPAQIKRLPVDERGFPVPFFVAWLDGRPDFRVIGPGKIEAAMKHRKCWICGQVLGSINAFCIGPMCTINKIAPEPPSHLDCVRFSARACPFLSRPLAKRNEKGMAEMGAEPPPGFGLKRNPGVVAVWASFKSGPVRVDGGHLWDIGAPCRPVEWFCEGRPATRAEVLHSIEGGIPALAGMARLDGPEAVADLNRYIRRSLKHLPADPDAQPEALDSWARAQTVAAE